MPLSKNNVKVQPLGANGLPHLTSPQAPTFEKITAQTYQTDTGVHAKYISSPSTECSQDIAYINSSEHAVIQLPTQQGHKPRLIKQFSNTAGGDKFNQHIKDSQVAAKDIKGVFSSGFSSCAFQVAHVQQGHDRFLVASHLQAGSALQSICADFQWDLDNDVDWVLNTTICNLGSMYQCYGSGAIKDSPARVLNLIRGIDAFPNHGDLVNAFGLLNIGVMINNMGNLQFYYAGGLPPSGSSQFDYFAGPYRNSWMIRPGEAFSLSQINQKDLEKRYLEFLKQGYIIDMWNFSRLSTMSKSEVDAFLSYVATTLAAGDANSAKLRTAEVLPTIAIAPPQNNCRSSTFMTPQAVGQWIAGAPLATACYAPVALR